MVTTSPADPGETIELALRPYRRPLRLGEAVGMAVACLAIFLWIGGAIFLWLHAPRWASALCGGAALLAVLGLWWRADHRAYPAGVLRVGPEGIVLDDGRRERAIRYGELRFLLGTGLALVLKGPGRRVPIDWPRFLPLAPRVVVDSVVARVAAQPEGPEILQRTARQAQRAVGLGRFLFWVFLISGVLMVLRLLLERAGPPR
jgi:hypothetical protein